jgi:flavin-dependent dehydrogenase
MVRGLPDRTDVFVIGGGPAGLAAALASRQAGFEVVLADSSEPPIDKPCGEGLMPDGVTALRGLGVALPAGDAQPFTGIRFCSGDATVAARFPSGVGYGVRRTALHELMAGAAERAGVNLQWRRVVTGVTSEGVVVGKDLVRARWIVGADGGNSRVRRWAGLDEHLKHEQRFAFRRHYRIAQWSEFMELHWGPDCQLYITAVGRDEVCVALISRDPKLRLDAALPYFPAVLERLRDAEHTSSEQGALTVTRKLARVCSGSVALIGDASGGVDAITGEGLCLAFRQAALLVEGFKADDLSIYERGHHAMGRRPAFMAGAMLLLEHRQALRRRVMAAFMEEPRIFARLLRMHVGMETPAGFAANGLALGWRLLSL